MAVLANTSHSVTDFNDAPVVDIFLQNNESLVQIYNNDNETYITDNWADGSPLEITPFVVVTGRQGNQVLSSDSTGYVARVQWYYMQANGDRIRINAVSESATGIANTTAGSEVSADDFVVANGGAAPGVAGNARTLTVQRNIVGAATSSSGSLAMLLESMGIIVGSTVTLVCEVVFRDATFGNIIRERTITLQGNNQSGSAFLAVIEQSNQFFSYTQTSNIVLRARLFLGGEELTGAIATGPPGQPVAGDGWRWDIIGQTANPPAANIIGDANFAGSAFATDVVNSGFNADIQTGSIADDNILIVQPDDVAGTEAYQMIVTYEGVAHRSNTVTVQDIADEFRIQGPAQVTLRNDQTQGQANYIMYQNGVEFQNANLAAGNFFVDIAIFTNSASGEAASTWDTSITGTDRVTPSYITPSYLDSAGAAAGNRILRLSFGAGASGATDIARFQVNFYANEITSTSDTITTVGVELNDNT